MALAIGTRVRIKEGGGMVEFVEKTGTITHIEKHGQTLMYRVQLDEPVMIDRVGRVTDDLWSRHFLTDLDDED